MEQLRFDRSQVGKIVKTDEGYLRGEAIVTRCGVFKYLNQDGTIRREARLPEYAFKKESLDSLKMIPVTNNHPTVLVDATNAKELSIGTTGETINIDGENILTTVTINVQDAINEIENNNKVELSLGYTLDLIEQKGVYNGQEYDCIQTNIKYNHLAVVERGRAGVSRLNFDSFECGMIVDENIKLERENMVKINIDNVDVEVDEAVKKAFDSLNARLDNATTEADTLKAKLDETEEQLKKAKEINSDSLISAKAKDRVELIAKASKIVNADSLYDLSDREIKLSVIKSRYDNLDLSDKSDDYVAARFDAICDLLNNDEAIKKQQEKAKEVNEPKKNLDALELVKNQWKEIK